MQNAAYVKMRNLQIGYTIPSKLLANSGISRLRYFSADNLFTITGFDGADPKRLRLQQSSFHRLSMSSYYPLTGTIHLVLIYHSKIKQLWNLNII